MRETSYLLRGTACKHQIRFFVADTTAVVQTALDLHKTAPAPTLLLGRLLTGALLMGADIKDEIHTLTLNIEAEGPLQGAIAIYEPRGKVRGYAKQPDYFAQETKLNWQIGKLLGRGTLNVIKDLHLKEPLIGTIELFTGEVAEDIAQYYLTSEQIPSAVSLGVLFSAEGKINSAGGYLIQELPDANPEAIERLKQNLNEAPYITDLLDMGMEWEAILTKILFKNMDVQIMEEIPAEYACSCSKERFADALRLLGKDELQSMREGVSPICHYCNNQYDFTPEEIQAIIASLETEGKANE